MAFRTAFFDRNGEETALPSGGVNTFGTKKTGILPNYCRFTEKSLQKHRAGVII